MTTEDVKDWMGNELHLQLTDNGDLLISIRARKDSDEQFVLLDRKGALEMCAKMERIRKKMGS
jgi:hypothetical protein